MENLLHFETLTLAAASERPDQALLLCDEILGEDERHLPAIELKAKSLWKMGKFALALHEIERAIALNPFDPGYHFLRGDCLQQLARYGEAVSAFERCRTSADGRLAGEAEARIKELEEWQHTVVASLLKSDPQFRKQYTRDPVAVLQAHGFVFSAVLPTAVATSNARKITLWARPS